MLHAMIMAGGAGTRFWPASRVDQPKQLLDLTGGRTMIQATIDRVSSLVPAERTCILTNQRLVPAIQQQLPDLPPHSILGEPCKRDTAPCIGLAAFLTHRQDPDATMVVMPADHVIHPTELFCETIEHAVSLVESVPERILTFGIRPGYPAESFGYIERGEMLDAADTVSPATYRVAQFREKPTLTIAQQYLESGSFYWNSGIFVWKAATILQALKQWEPAMYEHLAAIAATAETPEFEAALHENFTRIEGKSIDYAIMEKYDNVLVVEAPFQWNDVGNWQSLATMHTPDSQGNVILGKHLGIESSNSIIRSEKDHLVVTVGLDDVIVVHTEDATLIVNKQQEESVRQVVERLREEGWDQYL